jgi:hypothetical protein
MSQWDTVKASAMKTLGKGGKLPKERKNIDGEIAKFKKGFETFDKGREQVEKQLVDTQDACSDLKNAFAQYADLVDGDDLGLDSKKDEDKQKIEQARKILLDYINDSKQQLDTKVQELGTLNRALTDLRRLKDVKL